jgi:hypothetical protein
MHPNLAIIAQNRLGASPKNGISLEGIIMFLEKILAKTPNPELLRSIPVAKIPKVHGFSKRVAVRGDHPDVSIIMITKRKLMW